MSIEGAVPSPLVLLLSCYPPHEPPNPFAILLATPCYPYWFIHDPQGICTHILDEAIPQSIFARTRSFQSGLGSGIRIRIRIGVAHTLATKRSEVYWEERRLVYCAHHHR